MPEGVAPCLSQGAVIRRSAATEMSDEDTASLVTMHPLFRAILEAHGAPKPERDYPFCNTAKCPWWRGYCSRDPACND